MNIVFLVLFLLCIIQLMLQHQINHFLYFIFSYYSPHLLLWKTTGGVISTIIDILCVCSKVEGIDLLHFLAGCRKRRLHQALSVFSLSIGFFSVFLAVYLGHFLCFVCVLCVGYSG